MKTNRLETALRATPLLLALAALPAAAQVQLYGTLDAGAGRIKPAGGVATFQVFSGAMTTSFFGFRGSEDLGDGLKANFVLEGYLRVDTGQSGRFDADTFWSRTSEVSLSGGFGAVTLGRQTTFMFQNTASFNPLGGSFGFSPLIRNTFGAAARFAADSAWNNAVSYKSPTVAGGLSGGAMVALSEGIGSGRNTSAHARYASGPFAIGLVAQEVRSAFTVGKQRAVQLGASYDFGVVKAFGTYADIRATAVPNATSPGTTDRISQLGVNVPIGAGNLLASYSHASQKQALRPDRSYTTVGYVHNLSKRTNLYAMAMNDKLERQGSAFSWGLGMRHSF